MSRRDTRTTFEPDDADYSATFAALGFILVRLKPKKRAFMIAELEANANLPPAVDALPHHRRAMACIREAIKAHSEMSTAPPRRG